MYEITLVSADNSIVVTERQSVINITQTPITITVEQVGRKGDTGDAGADGADGADGTPIELRTTSTYIQWKYIDELTWNNLVLLSTLKGAKGDDGADGLKGDRGYTGASGKQVELQVSAGYIQWRYVGEAWENLYPLSLLKGDKGDRGYTGLTGNNGNDGADGKEVQIRTTVGYIQWKYDTDVFWTNLVSLASLKGDSGTEVELRQYNGYLQWHYVDGIWENLLLLSDLQGADGTNGADGRGIVSVTKINTVGLVDTYRILFTDATTSTFTVTNGTVGANGSNGTNGADGVGIASITLNSSEPPVDHYMITYTDASESYFDITNGVDGTNGTDGYTPYIEAGNWWINGVDTGIVAEVDITAFVPYTGADQTLDLGANSLIVSSVVSPTDSPLEFTVGEASEATDGEDVTFTAGFGGTGDTAGGDIIFTAGGKSGAGVDGKLAIQDPTSSIRASFDTSTLTTIAKTFTFPDKDGTFAMLDDVPSIAGLISDISGQDLSTADNTTSAFITAGDIPAETDPVFTAWDKDYDDLSNKPDLSNLHAPSSDNQDLSGYALTGHDHTGVYAPVLGDDDNYVTDAEKSALHAQNTDTMLPITASPTTQTGSGVKVAMEYGESITLGDLLYYKSDSKVYKADSTSIATAKLPCFAIALSTASSGSHDVLLLGTYKDSTKWTGGTALTVGGVCYMSTTGGTTQTQPATTDNVIQVVGIATATDTIYFKPDLTYITRT